ncbi:hypothetical protein RUMOBE_03411 [Blautia obeum ATCC 29174]|uniref:Uncharacterized protein n=1 Tax=Blautia obeum ATCC 29174 TaxID=411459 RepID=A5ZWL7_9FIRM|nr:hypothetical protein RUMOBE_03411 [Blautia obeum ATCC 29174]
MRQPTCLVYISLSENASLFFNFFLKISKKQFFRLF